MEICDFYLSDHAEVELEIQLTPQIRGRGVWKFHAALLKDSEYTSLARVTIKQTYAENIETADPD